MQLQRGNRRRPTSRCTQLRRLARIEHYQRSCTCSWVISWPVSSGPGPSTTPWPTRSARSTRTNDAGTANASASEYICHFASELLNDHRVPANTCELLTTSTYGRPWSRSGHRFTRSPAGAFKCFANRGAGLSMSLISRRRGCNRYGKWECK